jgi:hypothetical protein
MRKKDIEQNQYEITWGFHPQLCLGQSYVPTTIYLGAIEIMIGKSPDTFSNLIVEIQGDDDVKVTTA